MFIHEARWMWQWQQPSSAEDLEKNELLQVDDRVIKRPFVFTDKSVFKIPPSVTEITMIIIMIDVCRKCLPTALGVDWRHVKTLFQTWTNKQSEWKSQLQMNSTNAIDYSLMFRLHCLSWIYCPAASDQRLLESESISA